MVSQTLHKKWIFPLRISSVNMTKSAETADLATFTEGVLNGKIQFLCSEMFDSFNGDCESNCQHCQWISQWKKTSTSELLLMHGKSRKKT